MRKQTSRTTDIHSADDIRRAAANVRPRAGRAFPRLLLVLSALLVLAPAAAAQAAAGQYAAAEERFQIKSQVLGEERTILVRVPANYQQGTERYPVLYMTDGDAHIQHTGSTVAFLARNNRMPEMIVVGITNTDRMRDLSPTHVAQAPDNPNARFPTSGGADKFLKFIETELIPQVESKYRVLPFRALAGHSLGGLFAIHAMTARPELFNAYIAVSPALQWDNFVMIEKAKEFFKNRKEYNRTLYTTLGNEPGDIGDAFGMFRDVLSKQQTKGFAWEAVRLDDEDHGSVVLRSHYTGLRKVYDGWQYPRDPSTGAITGDFKAVQAHYGKLSTRLGYSILPPEPLVNIVGYQLMGVGKMEDAAAAFQWNVENYPRSANVYDSLAEFYERNGKLELARPNYEKAVALGKENKDPNLNIYQINFDRVSGLLSKAGASEKK
jgi:predicted alpha/beta superfamily hydrolase